MTLVDTSVWIDHFRGHARSAGLREQIELGDLLMHPWVLGELALGHLGTRRRAILENLLLLPRAPVVADHEVLTMIEMHRLANRGLGWVDAQLLASARIAGARLWTHDQKLAYAMLTIR